VNPNFYTATIDDDFDNQVVIGSWESRREAIGAMLNWAQRLVASLETKQVLEWALDDGHVDIHAKDINHVQ
jgi:hypothetical protein